MTERSPNPTSISTEDALVAVMVAVSAADGIETSELLSINRMVDHLPVFGSYDKDRIAVVAEVVYDLFEEEDGLDALFGLVRNALPDELNETAYAFACDVAAANGRLTQSELRILEEMRYELDMLHFRHWRRWKRIVDGAEATLVMSFQSTMGCFIASTERPDLRAV